VSHENPLANQLAGKAKDVGRVDFVQKSYKQIRNVPCLAQDLVVVIVFEARLDPSFHLVGLHATVDIEDAELGAKQVTHVGQKRRLAAPCLAHDDGGDVCQNPKRDGHHLDEVVSRHRVARMAGLSQGVAVQQADHVALGRSVLVVPVDQRLGFHLALEHGALSRGKESKSRRAACRNKVVRH
jgi:hypothetical protein